MGCSSSGPTGPESSSAIRRTSLIAQKKHVLISTKFTEPCASISKVLKKELVKLGYSVWNPNTDCVEFIRAMLGASHANEDRVMLASSVQWMDFFERNLEHVEETQGWILQVAEERHLRVSQGVLIETSPLQVAEERLAFMWLVPRLGVWYSSEAKARPSMTKDMKLGAQLAAEQWNTSQISEDVVPCSDKYVGGIDIHHRRHGQGRMDWPTGNWYVGQWVCGERSGEGKAHVALDSSIYEGQFVAGKRHGKGTLTRASGDAYVGDWAEGKKHGIGRMIKTDGSVYSNGTWENSEFKDPMDVLNSPRLDVAINSLVLVDSGYSSGRSSGGYSSVGSGYYSARIGNIPEAKVLKASGGSSVRALHDI